MHIHLHGKRLARKLAISVLAGVLGMAGTALAQIKTDGSLGPATTLSGTNITIPNTLGTTVGHNLFHSFTTFNVAQGQNATFAGPAGIANVLARVTGGSASTINGGLGCSISGANLYLVNPSGILFGPQARLNVSGSFYATTADHIELGDTGRFAATNPASSLLTVADPTAFGFLGPTPGAINVNQSNLAGATGASLQFVGGTITLNNPHLTTTNGNIGITSADGPGRIAINQADQADGDMPRYGAVIMQGTSSPTVWNLGSQGTSGGDILIRAGSLLGSSCSILAGGAQNATRNGNITIAAQYFVYLNGQSILQTGTSNAVRSGNITITAPLIAIDGSHIVSTTLGRGSGGDIALNASNGVSCDNMAIIDTDSLGSGKAGNLSLIAGNFLYFAGGTALSSDGILTGSNGTVSLTAPNIDLVGVSRITASGYGSLQAGIIAIHADKFTMTDSSRIVTNVISNTLAAQAGSITVDAADISMTDATIQSSPSFMAGHGGNITLTSKNLRMQNSALVADNRSPLGSSGSITITSDAINLANSAIDTQTYGTLTGGDLRITGNTIALTGATAVSSSTFGKAPAGNIIIRGGSLALQDASEITTSTWASGHGGKLDIQADQFQLSGKSLLSSAAWSTGAAGNLVIQGGNLLMDNSQIRAAATQSAGGNITLDVNGRIDMRRGAITTSVHGGTGSGGDIAIRAYALISDAGTIRADADLGHGGNIDIWSRAYLSTAASIISASSKAGLDGKIMVASTIIDVAGNLVVLPENILDVERMIPAYCEYRDPKKPGSSFLIAGRRGIPPAPGERNP